MEPILTIKLSLRHPKRLNSTKVIRTIAVTSTFVEADLIGVLDELEELLGSMMANPEK